MWPPQRGAAKEWCAQVVAVSDRARAAPGHGARHGHEPARAAPPRALARRRAPAGRQPAAARLARTAPTQGTHTTISFFHKILLLQKHYFKCINSGEVVSQICLFIGIIKAVA